MSVYLGQGLLQLATTKVWAVALVVRGYCTEYQRISPNLLIFFPFTVLVAINQRAYFSRVAYEKKNSASIWSWIAH